MIGLINAKTDLWFKIETNYEWNAFDSDTEYEQCVRNEIISTNSRLKMMTELKMKQDSFINHHVTLVILLFLLWLNFPAELCTVRNLAPERTTSFCFHKMWTLFFIYRVPVWKTSQKWITNQSLKILFGPIFKNQ